MAKFDPSEITPFCTKCGATCEYTSFDGFEYEYVCTNCNNVEYFEPGAFGEEEDDGDTLSVYDAADIWRSSGMDEDYTFGYSEDELRNA